MRIRNILFVIAVCGLASCGPAPDPNSLVGQAAPDFEVEGYQSANLKTTLAQFKGKAVILDFWATWCGPCRELSPYVEKIYEENKSKGLEAMAITDQARPDVQKFESETPHHIPVYIDQNDVANGEYKVQGLPTIVIIDKSGKIIYDEAGFIANQIQVADAAMRAAVDKALQPA